MTRRLNTAQLDRAAGVLLGMACGDALGAGYEFGPPLAAHIPVAGPLVTRWTVRWRPAPDRIRFDLPTRPDRFPAPARLDRRPERDFHRKTPN